MHASDLPTPDFSRFPRYAELTALLQAFAAARPDVCELRSIGKSHEGRDIWLVVLTRRATGADDTKPAFWIDGNIHAAELTACTAALYYLHHVLVNEATDTRLAHLLDTRVVYIVPRLNPDGAELALAEVPRFIRSSTRG
jgi:murein tripeptide amidase MpaA